MTNTNICVRFPGIHRYYSKIEKLRRPGVSWHISKSGERYWSWTKPKSSSSDRRFRLLLHFLRVFPRKLEEKDYVKLIKFSLAHCFSKQMDQELPVSEKYSPIPIFPPLTQKKLDNFFIGRRKDKCQFYFNLLQSKALCAPVGQDMIDEAYDKHFQSLCRPAETISKLDPSIKEKLFQYGAKVGREVERIYDPYSTTLPNQRASVQYSREKGGNLSQLSKEGRLKTYSGSPLQQISGTTRVEPFVVGLFGEPGSGKTTLVQKLIRFLGNRFFPGLSGTGLTYSRSCSMEHWDGYTGQPITVLDDFGQNLEDSKDLVEFENLISTNEFFLPMAHLEKKGQRFTSPIVIVTSNRAFGSRLDANGTFRVEDPLAVWRRFSVPILVRRDRRPSLISLELGHAASSRHAQKFSDGKQGNEGHWALSQLHYPYSTTEISSFALLVETLEDSIRSRFSHHETYIKDVWEQNIFRKNIIFSQNADVPYVLDVNASRVDLPSRDSDYTVSLEFPLDPPSHSPIVKAVALSEPLKVRMITAAEADTKVLQPFQKALWQYLGNQPQFCLTNGVKAPWSEHEDFENDTLPWIYRIEKMIQEIHKNSPESDSLWLSGDYDAATDNFLMEVTESLIEGILSEISHEPTRNWVRWETSSHEILYPKGRSGKQTSGQLMGSLLSFPLLCFLNDFSLVEAGFPPKTYLINGDDVVARGSLDKINSWRNTADSVGLKLSIGKNFIDSSFCTVNSQLFYEGNVLHTGKVSCQTRVGATLSYCLAETQFYWGPSDRVKIEFLKRNLLPLRRTPRSIHVSKTHGGLGLYNTMDHLSLDHGLFKRVYLRDLIERYSKISKIPGTSLSIICVPSLEGDRIQELVENSSLQDPINDLLQIDGTQHPPPSHDDLTHTEFRYFEKRITEKKKYGHAVCKKFQTIWKNGEFELLNFPSLSSFKVNRYVVPENTSSRLRDRSILLALDLLIGFSSNVYERQDPFLLKGLISDISPPKEILESILIDRNFLTGCFDLFEDETTDPIVGEQVLERGAEIEGDSEDRDLLDGIMEDFDIFTKAQSNGLSPLPSDGVSLRRGDNLLSPVFDSDDEDWDEPD
nr:MAG: putative RNA-dependent RNA polymerase [Narnaviridae sp.]